MLKTFYKVRVLDKDGKLVTKREFTAKTKALNFIADKLRNRRQVRIAQEQRNVLETHQNTEYTLAPHTPWESAPKPVKMLFIHHSVTKELPISATVAEEKAQMELLDQIAHSRGFNGISYCWGVFPSGRCWEGRGFGIIEAATEGFNTSSDSIVLVGNKSLTAMTEPQRAAVVQLIKRAQGQGFFVKTGLDVRAHREVSQTSCPGDKVSAADIAAIQQAVN